MIACVVTELYIAARLEVMSTCVKGLTDNSTLNARVSLVEFTELSRFAEVKLRSGATTDIDGTDPRVCQSDDARSEARANYLGSRRLRNRSIHVRLSPPPPPSRHSSASQSASRVYIVSIPLTFGFLGEVVAVAAATKMKTRG